MALRSHVGTTHALPAHSSSVTINSAELASDALQQKMSARKATPSLKVGAFLALTLLLTGLLAPWLAPYPPDEVGVATVLAAPSSSNLMGADQLGRDLLSRVIYGARAALLLAGIGVGVAALLGIGPGLAAGYYGGWPDRTLSRTMEVWLAFPGLLLAMILVARLGPSLMHAALALGIATAPGFFRLARAETLCAKTSCYVEAARALGAGDRRIIFRHILPNIMPSLIVLATMRAGSMILAGGGLSFVGLGAQPPTSEWGALLAQGRDTMSEAPWLAVYPGLAVMLSVAGLNLMGDGLRDWVEART